MDEADLTQLKLTQHFEFDSAQKSLPRHKKGGTFLKGPIPENWLKQAAQLPGKAFQVAVALWYWAGMKGARVVTLSQKLLRTWGVERNACYRALAALEKVKLISVERHRGRNPVVTILGVEEGDKGSNGKVC
jgi:hypothetical protein